MNLVNLSSCLSKVRGLLVEGILGGPASLQTRDFYKQPRRLPGFRWKKQRRSYKSPLNKERKDPEIPVAAFNPNFTEHPLSGTRAHEEDLVEEREKSREFISDVSSLNARGFLRFQKAYEPPANVDGALLAIVNSVLPETLKMSDKEVRYVTLENSKLKYEILKKASDELQHHVPNSLLYSIDSVERLIQFYATPVRTSTPFDDLVNSQADLPPNLFVQKNYVRFTEETKDYHGGVSAFPQSHTIVTGLRTKQKYKGFKSTQWDRLTG